MVPEGRKEKWYRKEGGKGTGVSEVGSTFQHRPSDPISPLFISIKPQKFLMLIIRWHAQHTYVGLEIWDSENVHNVLF